MYVHSSSRNSLDGRTTPIREKIAFDVTIFEMRLTGHERGL